MKNKLDTIKDFASSKAFEIKEEIIKIIRKQLCEPSDDFLDVLKEKMTLLEFIESYQMDDIVWDWVHDYYEIEEEEDLEEIPF